MEETGEKKEDGKRWIYIVGLGSGVVERSGASVGLDVGDLLRVSYFSGGIGCLLSEKNHVVAGVKREREWVLIRCFAEAII